MYYFCFTFKKNINMEIEVSKLNEILNKNFKEAGYNCDEEQERKLWLATRQTIHEILVELKVDIIKSKQK